MDRISEIRKVLIITLVLNAGVSAAKIAYGYLTYSVSIFSDGFHSLFDGVSNVIGMIGIQLSSHPPDEAHPYGHRKYETVFTIFIGLLMLLTCFEVFKRVYESLTGGHAPVVTSESFLVMGVTMAVNIFVATYERSRGKKLDSEFLIADSRHTKSDIYVSSGVIANLVLIRLGVPLADPVAGVIVGLLVARAGIGIIRESTEMLVDRTMVDMDTINRIASDVGGVIGCHGIRTRGAKGSIFVDLHVVVNPFLSVEDAHKIADTVEEEIKTRLPGIVDVVVHIEPSDSV